MKSLRTLGELIPFAATTDLFRKKDGEKTYTRACLFIEEIMGSSTSFSSLNPPRLRQAIKTLQARDLSPATVNRYLAAFSSLCRLAYDDGLIKSLPVIRYLPEPRGRERVISSAELEQIHVILQAHAEPAAQSVDDLVRFLHETGLRVSEGLKLRWEDFQAIDGHLWVHLSDTKNGDDGWVPLSQEALRIRDSRLAGGGPGPFFRLSQKQVNYYWDAARRQMGLADDPQFVPHALRHTFATRLAQAGHSLLTIGELLRHRSVRSTARYAHLTKPHLARAVAGLKTLED